MTKAHRGILYMVLSALLFASMGACLKFILDVMPVYEAIFFRSIISSLILGLLLFGHGIPYLGTNRKFLLLRSVAGFLAMSAGFFALSKIPLADAAVLHHTSPLFVALWSVLLLGERVTSRLILLIVVSLMGVVMVIQPQWQFLNLYGLAGLASGIFSGLAYVFVRHLHQTEHTWVIAFHFTTFTSLVSLPLMMVSFIVPTPLQWVALIGAGLFGTGGQILMTLAYRYEIASHLAPFSYASVVLSFVYGMLFWGEVPNRFTGLGMILIIATGIAIARLRFPATKTPPSEVTGP